MINAAEGYVFFEVVEPEELSYTYKVMPADFATTFNETLFEIGLVPVDPACGCGAFQNAEEVEGKIALIEVLMKYFIRLTFRFDRGVYDETFNTIDISSEKHNSKCVQLFT